MSNLLPDQPDDESTKDLIVALGSSGPFNRGEAADALTAAGNETDVDELLAALEARQAIIKLGGEPPSWELVVD